MRGKLKLITVPRVIWVFSIFGIMGILNGAFGYTYFKKRDWPLSLFTMSLQSSKIGLSGHEPLLDVCVVAPPCHSQSGA